jgi:hypothetical protein
MSRYSASPPPGDPEPEALALQLDLSLSRPVLLPRVFEEEPLHVLLRVGVGRSGGLHPLLGYPVGDSESTKAGWLLSELERLNAQDHRSAGYPPKDRMPPERLTRRHLCMLLDASGSMHRIVLDGQEREQWIQRARQRGDLKRGLVDGREGWLWSGRTLAELQAQKRTPMQAALRALTRAGERLRPEDGLTVVAFADRARRMVAATAPDRARQIETTVAALASGIEGSGLGHGTRVAEALRLALEEFASPQQAPGERGERLALPPSSLSGPRDLVRLLLISDGLLEDRTACGEWVERIAAAGLSLSCIGVGDQFDEEWLMWAADVTRGRFCYAPTADALEAAVAEELSRLETLAVHGLGLTLRPMEGALFRDLCQVSPDLSALHRMETDGTVYSFSLGDLTCDREALFLAELAAPALPPGRHPLVTMELMGESVEGKPLEAPPAQAVVLASGDLSAAGAAPADEVLDAVAAVHAYRAERRAQRALRRGQLGEATRHLRDTRQIVDRLGHTELAAELEAQAAAFEAGARPSAESQKRIKAETRRLGMRR